jgi:hypothetical protein
MSKDQRPKFQDGSKATLFLELADPDDLGFSRKVSTAEVVGNIGISYLETVVIGYERVLN